MHEAPCHFDSETHEMGRFCSCVASNQEHIHTFAVCSASCLVFFWNFSRNFPCWKLQGVEEVATQNTVLSAKAVLKGLVKSIDVAICQEVEVVAAKYDLKDGKVSIVKRGWFSGRSFYYE